MDKQIGKSDRAVEIEANAGVIKIKGQVESMKDAEKIEQMVRKMPGVKDVIFADFILNHY